jgi:hypothetical protein
VVFAVMATMLGNFCVEERLERIKTGLLVFERGLQAQSLSA